MPPIGPSITPECLVIVQPLLTIVFLWLVLMLVETGKSRTHGGLLGDNLDLSGLVQGTLVGCAITLESIPGEKLIKLDIYLIY